MLGCMNVGEDVCPVTSLEASLKSFVKLSIFWIASKSGTAGTENIKADML